MLIFLGDHAEKNLSGISRGSRFRNTFHGRSKPLSTIDGSPIHSRKNSRASFHGRSNGQAVNSTKSTEKPKLVRRHTLLHGNRFNSHIDRVFMLWRKYHFRTNAVFHSLLCSVFYFRRTSEMFLRQSFVARMEIQLNIFRPRQIIDIMH